MIVHIPGNRTGNRGPAASGGGGQVKRHIFMLVCGIVTGSLFVIAVSGGASKLLSAVFHAETDSVSDSEEPLQTEGEETEAIVNRAPESVDVNSGAASEIKTGLGDKGKPWEATAEQKQEEPSKDTKAAPNRPARIRAFVEDHRQRVKKLMSSKRFRTAVANVLVLVLVATVVLTVLQRFNIFGPRGAEATQPPSFPPQPPSVELALEEQGAKHRLLHAISTCVGSMFAGSLLVGAVGVVFAVIGYSNLRAGTWDTGRLWTSLALLAIGALGVWHMGHPGDGPRLLAVTLHQAPAIALLSASILLTGFALTVLKVVELGNILQLVKVKKGWQRAVVAALPLLIGLLCAIGGAMLEWNPSMIL